MSDAELERRVEALTQENAELRARVAALEEQLRIAGVGEYKDEEDAH